MRTARFRSRLSGRAATQRVIRFDQNICDLSEDGIPVVFSDVETLRSGQCTVRHSLPTWNGQAEIFPTLGLSAVMFVYFAFA